MDHSIRLSVGTGEGGTVITVGNKKHGAHGVYVGRPSPLGNPYLLYCEEDRMSVIAVYEGWLIQQLSNPRSAASIEIHRLVTLARKHDVCLVCWCAPKPCHADVIKRVMEGIIQEGGSNVYDNERVSLRGCT